MAENTATPDNDAGLQLKKRARRRLVGAVALAVLAAIVLPMVMDHEPRPPVQDIQIRIPSQDAGTFSSRVLLEKPTAKSASPAIEKPVAPPKEEAVQPLAEPVKMEPKPEVKPEPKLDTKLETKLETKPEVKADKKPAEVTRAERALAGEEGNVAEQWILRLGSYQDPGNVKALQAKLKELGYASYTEKVATPQGERIRVRAGPFSSKAAAEKAQAALKKVGAGGPPGGEVALK